MLVVAADLEPYRVDGRTARSPADHRRRLRLSVLLERAAGGAGRGLGGVMTTFLSRVEPAAVAFLGLPPDHALAATIFLGRPRTSRRTCVGPAVASFATVDRFDGDALST